MSDKRYDVYAVDGRGIVRLYRCNLTKEQAESARTTLEEFIQANPPTLPHHIDSVQVLEHQILRVDPA